MNEIDSLLTDEQKVLLSKLASRFRVDRAELLVAAAMSCFDGVKLGPDFDGQFMEDIRRYVSQNATPQFLG